MLNPLSFRRFGGLILNQPLDEVGQENAIDLLDVDRGGSAGALRTRDGAAQYTKEAALDNYIQLFPHSSTRLLAVRESGKLLVALEGIAEKEGVEIAGKTIAVKVGWHKSFTRLGTPSASYTFIADREGTVKRYDGTSFSEPKATVDAVGEKAMPKAVFLTTWAEEGNRLVIAGTDVGGGPNGATSSTSHVWFSNPGAPESYESTAFVQLSPGDGEEIVGCCEWGGQVFVFKGTKLFVFYGISSDSEGQPIFNFRTVDLGTRILLPTTADGPKVVAGADGVYFVANDGVYMTTGGEPSLLSEELDPLARSAELIGPAATTFGARRFYDARGIARMGNDLFVGLGLGEGITHLLKLDLHTGEWTVWGASFYGMVPWNDAISSGRERLFFSASGSETKHIYYYTPAKTTDPSAEMSPRWQAGLYDADFPDEKTLTWAKLYGTGKPDVKVAKDFGSLGSAVSFELGVSPAVAGQERKLEQTGTLFSHQISGTGPWSVQRLDRHLRETRVPAMERS